VPSIGSKKVRIKFNSFKLNIKHQQQQQQKQQHQQQEQKQQQQKSLTCYSKYHFK
jgi:hypothetical protein